MMNDLYYIKPEDNMEQMMRKRPFAGNGMSRTAMLFKIATVGGIKLTVPQLNKIKTINHRSLERVYDEVVRTGDKGSARFALSLMLK